MPPREVPNCYKTYCLANQERPSCYIYIYIYTERRNRKKSRALSCTKRFEDEVVVVDEVVVEVVDEDV